MLHGSRIVWSPVSVRRPAASSLLTVVSPSIFGHRLQRRLRMQIEIVTWIDPTKIDRAFLHDEPPVARASAPTASPSLRATAASKADAIERFDGIAVAVSPRQTSPGFATPSSASVPCNGGMAGRGTPGTKPAEPIDPTGLGPRPQGVASPPRPRERVSPPRSSKQ